MIASLAIGRLKPLNSKLLTILFGEKLSSSEIALHRAASLPRPVSLLVNASRLVLAILLGMAAFGFHKRIPIIGQWMAETWWHLHTVWGALLAVSIFGNWAFKRRIKHLRPVATSKDKPAT